jgi:hypothetical protein
MVLIDLSFDLIESKYKAIYLFLVILAFYIMLNLLLIYISR